MTEPLRVVLATPLDPRLCDLLQNLEPRIELVADHTLLPPRRHPADFAGDPAFRRTHQQQQEFERHLQSAHALFGIPDLDPATLAATVRSNPELRWVHTMAAGGGSQVRAANLSHDELSRVSFTTSAGVHGPALAEFAAFGILAGAKSLPRLVEQKQHKTWSERWTMAQVAYQRALVVGYGGIGRAVAQTLKALGMHVTVMARTPTVDRHVDQAIAPDTFLEAAGTADAVVQTLPGTDSTRHFLNTDFFDSLKHGSTFVSIGRGTVIDEPALIRALTSGRVGFAALDVFENEPLPQNSKLWDLPNVLISPHTAALTTQEERSIVELFADNAARLLDGRPLLNRVNTIEFY